MADIYKQKGNINGTLQILSQFLKTLVTKFIHSPVLAPFYFHFSITQPKYNKRESDFNKEFDSDNTVSYRKYAS